MRTAMVVLVPGARLDRYELVCPVAQGGMAAVWLARVCGKAGFEKRFALKVILPQHANDPLFQRMLLDEARIAARLVHTNVAQIVDLGEARGVLYIAMEWVDGDTLLRLARAVRAKGERLPSSIALRLLADTCAGLHAAHELRDDAGQLLGVVHRDVSPHNILVSTQGVAKLIDFGIAKSEVGTGEATSSGTLKGKVLYMAPEQATAGSLVDRRADVWAIGATLHFLLTGSGPFEAENEVVSLQRLMAGGPRAPLPPDTPPRLAALVERALVHDRERRAATTAELHDEILRIMAEDRRLAATSADVAAFLEHHLGSKLQERRASYAAAIAGLPRAHVEDEEPELIEPGDATTLGPAAIEAIADARSTRTRVLVASALASVVVAAIAGAVALTRGGGRSTTRASALAASLAPPPAPPLPSPSASAQPSATSASRSAPESTPASSSTSPDSPRPPPRPTATALPRSAPPAPIHRDYGF